MGLPKEVIEYAIRSTADVSAAALLIDTFDSRRDKVQARRRRAQAMRERVELEILAMMQIEICQHEVTKTHGDPSGNGDSSEECLICGEWL
jgi:hypothetical protein